MPYRSPLRAQQAAATHERILRACVELVSQRDSLDLSMSELARVAGVSEPTVYRHFPTKRDLFFALATLQFERVTEGLDPRTPDELAAAVRTVFARAETMESLVRWTLATPLAQGGGRPSQARRLKMLRQVVGEPTDLAAEHLQRVLLLFTSPLVALYWKDYLGLTTEEAAETAAWGIRTLLADRGTTSAVTKPADHASRDDSYNAS